VNYDTWKTTDPRDTDEVSGPMIRGVHYLPSIDQLVVDVAQLEDRITPLSTHGDLLDVANAVNDWLFWGGIMASTIRIIADPDTPVNEHRHHTTNRR
jgi:hypothetical protein